MPHAPFVAMIIPLGDAPGGGGPQPQPPGIWGPTDPRPTPPIAGWNPGTGTWPTPPGGGGGPPPVAGWPIVPGWGGSLPGGGGFPGQGGPVDPGYSPPWATPGPGGGGQPPGIWGPPGPWPSPPIAGIPGLPGSPDQQPHPEHPIVLPPDLPETLPPPDERPIEWKTAWTPQTGWIVVGVPTGPTPTPSGAPPQAQPLNKKL